MEKFEKVQYPQPSETPHHRVSGMSYFISSPGAPDFIVQSTNTATSIDPIKKYVDIIVLEEYVGYEGLWAKVVYDARVGYVLQEEISRIDSSVLPSIEPNIQKEYLADSFVPTIDWKAERSNIVFDDARRGVYSVIYDTTVEYIQPGTMPRILEESLYQGLSLILKNLGKRFDIEYMEELQKKFYLFGKVEAIDFYFRKCSTLRVLVSLPKVYAHSNFLEKNKNDLWEVPEDPEEEEDTDDGESPSEETPVVEPETPLVTTGGNTLHTVKEEEEKEPEKKEETVVFDPPKQKYIDILFASFSEYDSYFNDLDDALEISETIFNRYQWRVGPEYVDLNITRERSDVRFLRSTIDDLIYLNLPKNKKLLSEVYGINLERFDTDYNPRDRKILDIDPGSIHWEGRLVLRVNPDNLSIISMNFKTPITKRRLKFTKGVDRFLQDPIVNNPTTVNYILKKHLSTCKKEVILRLREEILKKTIEVRIQQINGVEETNLFTFSGNVFNDLKNGFTGVVNISKSFGVEAFYRSLSLFGVLKIYDVPPEILATLKAEVLEKLKKYKTIFNYDPFKKEIDELAANKQIIDEFAAVYGFAYTAGYTTLVLPAIGATVLSVGSMFSGAFSSQEDDGINFGPESSLSDFLTKFHYPKIDFIQMMDIDAVNCLASNFSAFQKIVAKGKNLYKQDWKQDFKEREKKIVEKETNAFLQGLKNFFSIRDTNLRIVFLRDSPPTPPPGTPVKLLYEFNDWWLPALKQTDIATILMDCLKCAVASMDPATLSSLMNRYKNAKKLINQFLASTLCNPFLSALLGKLAALEIPNFFTYDPNENLANMLINFIVDLAKKVLVMSVRALLNKAFNNCLEDKNKEQNPGAESLQDPLLNAADDANIDDILADLGLYDPTAYLPPEPGFVEVTVPLGMQTPVQPPGLPSGFAAGSEETPEEEAEREFNKEAARTAAKEKVKSFIADLTCILSAKEICTILKGETASSEVYEIIRTIAAAKHPDLANKLNSYEQIMILFKRLGLNFDITICDEIENSQDPIPINCSCDDGSVQKAREKILKGVEVPITQGFEAPIPFVPDNISPITDPDTQGSGANPGKGLTNDEVAAIIDNENARQEAAVEEILKFLDDPNPFAPEKLPPSLCIIRPDGTVVPPAFNLNPPIESFKGMLNSLAEPVYKTFDVESSMWPTTTFSQELPPSAVGLAKLDDKNQIVIRTQVDVKSLIEQGEKEESQIKPPIPPLPPSSQPWTHSAYLFNNLLANSQFVYKFPYTDSDILNKQRQLSFNLESSIKGSDEFKLNTGIVYETVKKTVNDFNTLLERFIFSFMNNFQLKIRNMLLNDAYADLYPSELYNILLSNAGVNPNFHIESKELKYLSLFDLYGYTRDRDNFWKQFFPKNTDAFASSIESLNYPIIEEIMSFFVKPDKSINTIFKSGIVSIASHIGYTNALTQLDEIIDNWKKLRDFYKDAHNINGLFPDFNVGFKDNLYYGDFYNLKISKNTKSYINIQFTDESSTYVSIINEEIKRQNSLKPVLGDTISITKKGLFTHFTKNPTRKINDFTENDYIEISKIMFERIKQKTSGSLFLKEYESAPYQPPVLKTYTTKNEDDEVTKVTYKWIPALYSYAPITNLLTLKLEGIPTAAQKACGIYPHFLDIDLLKDEAVEAKKESICIEEAVNNKIRQNKPVTTKELQYVELNDTQMILANLAHQLTLRIYVADILLRGVGIFGVCDPQYLRNDSLFIKYISSIIESEIKGVDSNYYDVMTSFFLKKHNINYPDNYLDVSDSNKRKVFQEMIEYTLKNSSLPKLSKRIRENTNKALIEKQVKKLKYSNAAAENPYQIELRYFDNFKDLQWLFNDSKDTTLRLEDNGILNYKGKQVKLTDNVQTFTELDPNFKYLFEFLFPVKKYFTYLFICNSLGTSTRKSILDAFISTKSLSRSLSKKIQSSGQPIVKNVNDPQEMQENPEINILSFIIKALLETPPKIIKSFIEGIDPNVKLTSFAYIVGRIFKEDFPDTIKPTIGVPLMAAIFTPFMFNPLNVIYYSSGMWREEKNDSNDEKGRRILGDLLDSTEEFICEDPLSKFHDDVVLLGNRETKKPDSNGYYYSDINKELINQEIQKLQKQLQELEAKQAEEDVEDNLE